MTAETNESKQENETTPALEKHLCQIIDQIQKLNSRVSDLEKQRGVSGDNLGQIRNPLQELNSKVSCLEEQKVVSGNNSEEPENK